MLSKQHSRPVVLNGAGIAYQGDIWQCPETFLAGDGVLLVCSGESLEMLLNIL